MNCRTCNRPMIVVERSGIELDYCLSCRAIWFDSTELELLADAVRPGTTLPSFTEMPLARTNEKARICPRCDQPMDKLDAGGDGALTIDVCNRGHGLWFDHGELGNFFGKVGAASDSIQPVVSFLGEALGTTNEGGK